MCHLPELSWHLFCILIYMTNFFYIEGKRISKLNEYLHFNTNSFENYLFCLQLFDIFWSDFRLHNILYIPHTHFTSLIFVLKNAFFKDIIHIPELELLFLYILLSYFSTCYEIWSKIFHLVFKLLITWFILTNRNCWQS